MSIFDPHPTPAAAGHAAPTSAPRHAAPADLALHLALDDALDDASGRAPRRAPGVPVGPPLARAALGAALGVGLLADLLLRDAAPGLGLSLVVVALLGVVLALARRAGRPVTLGAAILAALAALFALMPAWRATPVLVLLDLLALASLCAALAAALREGEALPLERAAPADYVRGALRTVRDGALGAPTLLGASAGVGARGRRLASLGVWARGALLAAPALLVFAALLAQADPAFDALMGRAFSWDVGTLGEHAAVVAVVTWGAAGLLHATLRAPTPAPDAGDGDGAAAPARAAWATAFGAREAVVALALVDALFAAFVLVQLDWLVGGDAVVAATGTTYAEYARRGFFELAAVSALALPTLLGVHHLVSRDAEDASARTRVGFLAAGATLVVCVLVMLLGAADRMRLYQAAYGLTEARFHASAFMAWLAFAFVWAAGTLLRGQAALFAAGTAASAWAWALALHVIDPQTRIVSVNLARAEAGRPLDVAYLADLGADAVPALTRDALPLVLARGVRAEACALTEVLDRAERRLEQDGAGWRGANVARWRARRAFGDPRTSAGRTRAAVRCGLPPDAAARRVAARAAVRDRASVPVGPVAPVPTPPVSAPAPAPAVAPAR